jgi:hypothetical protein
VIGRMTEAGMGGIDDTEGAAGIVSATCVVEIKWVCVDCADGESVSPEHCGCTVEDICCEDKGSTLTVGPDAEPGTSCGAASLLNAKGADVRGGGSGVPLGSPRTLRFNGGSSALAVAVLPFLLPTLESLPPPALLVAARASCSSNMPSQSASTVQ